MSRTMSRTMPWTGFVLLAVLLGTAGEARAAWGVSGPMVGHVTATTATIWLYPGARAKVLVTYRRAADPTHATHTVAMPPYTAGPGTCRVTLKGLQAATPYVYGVTVGGRHEARWRGTFTTAPPPGTPTRFRMAFTSCMRHDDEDHASFKTLAAQHPAFLLLLGDNVYADTTNREKLWREHLRMRRVPEFAALIRSMPTWAIWDDHDYGRNDSDETQVGKDQSLLAFQELFPNPSFGTPEVPGVFFRFVWGDVEFFMLDVRYHRTPNRWKDGPEKHMLGEGQFRWLVEGLRASRARFKVLVSGSTLGSDPEDAWSSFAHARDRLFGFIRDQRVEGVLFFTGDLHSSEIVVHPRAQTGFYDLFEVISSGIAVGGPHSFATVDFDTTLADPTAHIRIVQRDGSVSAQRTVRLSELRMPPP